MTKLDEGMLAFLFGAVVALIIAGTLSKMVEVNISDAELYRFCMVQEIPLEQCKIPTKPLTGGQGDE